MAALEEMVLLPEAQARRRLAGRIASFSVLSPIGAYAGVGTLRVLRLGHPKERGTASGASGAEGTEAIQIIAGYDSYERLS